MELALFQHGWEPLWSPEQDSNWGRGEEEVKKAQAEKGVEEVEHSAWGKEDGQSHPHGWHGGQSVAISPEEGRSPQPHSCSGNLPKATCQMGEEPK